MAAFLIFAYIQFFQLGRGEVRVLFHKLAEIFWIVKPRHFGYLINFIISRINELKCVTRPERIDIFDGRRAEFFLELFSEFGFAH